MEGDWEEDESEDMNGERGLAGLNKGRGAEQSGERETLKLER